MPESYETAQSDLRAAVFRWEVVNKELERVYVSPDRHGAHTREAWEKRVQSLEEKVFAASSAVRRALG